MLIDFLNRVSVITGYSLPNEKKLEYLVSELSTFLIKSKMQVLTKEEMLLAFRIPLQGTIRFSNGDYVQFPQMNGDFISVDYISKVFSNYWILRMNFDQMLINSEMGY